MPMLRRVPAPNGFIGVGDIASITTGVAGRVAGIVEGVIVYIFLVTTNRALMPMLRRVPAPNGFIGMGDGSNIATGVAVCIA